MELKLNGYTELPRGKLAAVVTYLEMQEPPQKPAVERRDLLLRRWIPGDLSEYRSLFRRIGEPWLWFSRLLLTDDQLREVLGDPRVEVYFLERGGTVCGLLELDGRQPPDIEIAFLGVLPEFTGQGAGRFLLSQAASLAFRHHPRRLWLHTCTLDHPGALDFYRKWGFRPYRRAIEVADDPRWNGILPKEAAPQIPLL